MCGVGRALTGPTNYGSYISDCSKIL